MASPAAASILHQTQTGPRPASSDDAACELLESRLQLVANYRDDPLRLFEGKALGCDNGFCSGFDLLSDGPIGAEVPEVGSGVWFRFWISTGRAKNVDCITFGLRDAGEGLGLVRCTAPPDSNLTGMTIIFDNQCRAYRVTVFDEAYLLKNPHAADADACDDEHLPNREATLLTCMSTRRVAP